MTLGWRASEADDALQVDIYLESLLARPHWSVIMAEEEAALNAARARRSAAAANQPQPVRE